MSSSLALLCGAAGGIILGNGFWSLLPSWQSEVPSPEAVRVEGPVSDSTFATVECNCQCPSQDNTPLIAGAFVSGIAVVILFVCLIRCWRAQLAPQYEPEPRITRYYSAPAQVQHRQEIEDLPEPRQRKTVVTPSTRHK